MGGLKGLAALFGKGGLGAAMPGLGGPGLGGGPGMGAPPSVSMPGLGGPDFSQFLKK